jgi:c-di-GMP-related signal transduction protein
MHEPPRESGGGIDTQNAPAPQIVTRMLGRERDQRVRETELRARFLTFEPIFNRQGKHVARELIIRGLAPPASQELARMEEDMRLTGLYSLQNEHLLGEQPLLVTISPDTLLSDVPEQLADPRVIWNLPLPENTLLARCEALRLQGHRFCYALGDAAGKLPLAPGCVLLRQTAHSRPLTPPPGCIHLVDSVDHPGLLGAWPANAWVQGAAYSGLTRPPESDSAQRRLEGLRLALRQPEALPAFLRMTPDFDAQIVRIASSAAGGLSQTPQSASHALVLLGRQRSVRVMALLALCDAPSTPESRRLARVALARALFMARLSRQYLSDLDPDLAFDCGLFSPLPLSFGPQADLPNQLGWPEPLRAALNGQSGPLHSLLQLAHASENADASAMARHCQTLGLATDTLGTDWLEAILAADDLDRHLISGTPS